MNYSDFKTQYASGLNPQQEAAVRAVHGPVLLLAVPGSGKTTVLVTRLGYMVLCQGILPEQILTMTYTVAATADMRERFAGLFGSDLAGRMEFRTINGVSARIIQHYERSLGRKSFDLVTDEGKLSAMIREICHEINHVFATESTVKIIRTWITYIKNMQLSDAEIDELHVEDMKLGPIYREYCCRLRQRRQMDYDDQMVYAYRILRQFPEILKFFQEKYPYLCVDEAQDTSKIQHQIIRLIAQGSKNLFLVGDEDQSIYGFRAAYPTALLEFDQVHPHATVLMLEQNYRSTAQIVEAADRFIQRNQNRHPKHMVPVRGSGADIRVIEVKDRKAQYRYLEQVARTCQSETAILYRNNDSALPLIDLMSRAGIGYRCRQFDTSFFTHWIVRDISDIIRFAWDGENGELFLRIYYKLSAGITKTAAEAAVRQGGGAILEILAESTELSRWSRTRCKALYTHLNNLRNEPADRAVYRLVHYLGYGDYLEGRDADTSKIAILEAIGASEPNPQRLLDRLEELATIVQEGDPRSDCPLILSTIHSSKGLEYETVYLMDVADHIFPACLPSKTGNNGEECQAYEEERRLFYVGMTRAKQRLNLFRFQSSALHATFIEELVPKQPKTEDLRQKIDPRGAAVLQASAEQRIPTQEIAENMKPGTLVEHQTFGLGVVASVQGDIISIDFIDGQVKRFSLTVALKRNMLQCREAP